MNEFNYTGEVYEALQEELLEYVTNTIDLCYISRRNTSPASYSRAKKSVLTQINLSIIYYWYSTTNEYRKEEFYKSFNDLGTFYDYDYPEDFKEYLKYIIKYNGGETSKIDEFISYTDTIYEKLLILN